MKYCGSSREVSIKKEHMSSFSLFPLMTGCYCDGLVLGFILDYVKETLYLKILEVVENLSTTEQALEQISTFRDILFEDELYLNLI